MSRLRIVSLALAAAVTAALLGLGLALPAQAESFRYWGYYYSEADTWTFAQAGPSDTIPPDGAVEGWRFAVTGEASQRFPRAAPDVDVLCAGVEPAEGTKQVGVVIDYGTEEDAPEGDTVPAPRGACAQVPEDATGSDVLAAVAELRLGEGGFICGIDGYPSAGCGDQVDVEAPSGDEAPVALELPEAAAADAPLSWTPIVVAVAVVALVATVAVLITRRRRTDEHPGA
jgi:hypothetical protein